MLRFQWLHLPPRPRLPLQLRLRPRFRPQDPVGTFKSRRWRGRPGNTKWNPLIWKWWRTWFPSWLNWLPEENPKSQEKVSGRIFYFGFFTHNSLLINFLAPREISTPQKPESFRGSAGKPITLASNYIRLSIEEGKGVFEYQVAMFPPVDDFRERRNLIDQLERDIGKIRVITN